MHSINALSLTSNVNSWLANSRHPQILHVFDSACNLINERREILSVVTAQIGNGPFNLVVEEDVLFSDHLNTESPISIRAEQLHLGDLTINTGGAKRWSPRPDWKMLHAGRTEILNQLKPLSINNYEPLLPDHLLTRLCSALVNSDISSALPLTPQLAGLGAGLTPAGDDFIIGAILATWIIHPAKVAKTLAEAITNTAAPLTTSISAAWLRSAGKGEAGILWHDLFDALIAPQQIAIEGAINKILAVGETSGADALAGFMKTLTQ
jgi:hypothetical protein